MIKQFCDRCNKQVEEDACFFHVGENDLCAYCYNLWAILLEEFLNGQAQPENIDTYGLGK